MSGWDESAKRTIDTLAGGVKHEKARADAAERLLVSLLADLGEQIATQPCSQCNGTGRQQTGERGVLRAVDAPPPTEECHLCRGDGTWTPIAVEVSALHTILAKYAPDTTTNEPVEPDPFTDNDTDQDEP